jgi:hypothetical protein
MLVRHRESGREAGITVIFLSFHKKLTARLEKVALRTIANSDSSANTV